MAAVTLAGTISNTVPGSVNQKHFPDVSIATTGDTLATGLQTILNAYSNKPASITAMSFSGGTITFTTTGGAVNNAKVTVIGY